MLGLNIEAISLASWLKVLFGAVPLLLLTNIIYNIFFHPLARIPGPFWARATGIPSWYHALRGRRHVWLWRQFQIYGSRIRPAPNLVLFCDPEAYADIYSMKSNVRRSNFYTALRINDLDAHTLNTVDVAEHAAKRRILNVCFSEKSVRAASKFIIQHVDRWNQLMLEEPVDSEGWSAPVDLTEKLTQLVFDITGDLSFGTSFNTKEPGDNPLKEIPHSIAEAMQFVYPIVNSPFLNIFLWLKPRGLNVVLDALTPPTVRRYYDFVNKSVSERKALYKLEAEKPEEERRQDVFYFLCEARDPKTGAPALDDHALLAESKLLVIAGTDTTVNGLSGFFFYITKDAWRCQKLLNEIQSTFESAEEIVYGPKLTGCVYLKACLEEGLRLAPAGLSEQPREVLPGGLQVKGEYYPPGTIVGTAQWCNSHNEEIYGDPRVYRPERWIVDESAGITKDTVARMRANFNPFLSGPGSCVGKSLATAEMMLIVARTLYRVEFKRVSNSTLGCGGPELGWGARDRGQMQLIDAYVAIGKGPEVQFRKRSVEKPVVA